VTDKGMPKFPIGYYLMGMTSSNVLRVIDKEKNKNGIDNELVSFGDIIAYFLFLAH
jgi:hypothetical protein